MGVHLGKTEVGHRRGLKSAHHLVAAGAARPEFFQQLNGFGRGHAWFMICDL